MSDPSIFDRDYYENGIASGKSLYTDYRWLPSLTVPMAGALVRNLGIAHTDSILDFGCAKGYLVKALRILLHDAYGCDISEYAISQADDETRPHLFQFAKDFWPHEYDWVICKDVLEHLEESEALAILKDMRANCKNIFIAVPLGNGHAYTIPEMEKDITHKIRQPLWWWSGLVEEAGFKIVSSTFAMSGIKENWTRTHKFGNGFIVAK